MGAEKHKTILLVEDEVITAKGEKLILEKYGYKVIIANCGEEAVAIFEKTPAIDLILMDINLGSGMDGTEAAAIILSRRDIPVVFLSSHTEPEIVEKTEKITSYGYVVKASSNTVLIASIKMAFKLFAAIAALRESESKLHEAQKLAHIGIWEWQTATDTVTWTGELYRIAGLDPLRPAPSYAEHHTIYAPESWAALKTAVEKAMVTAEPYQLELKLMRPDGSSRYVNAFGGAKQDSDGRVNGLYGIVQDISERKQVEASLKQALDWQQMIFEGSRDAIFISDQDSRFVAVNNAACNLSGYSREQLLKMRIPDIHDLSDLDAYKLYHQRIFAGEEILSEAKILRSDSEKIDTEFSNRCVSIAGKLYMHTTARDITIRKKVEAEIKRQLAEKEILLREVHHRIKNNIASIGGLLSLHMQSITNPEAVAVLQDAYSRINSMRILYDKLLLSEGFKDISVKNYIDDLIEAIVAIFPGNAKIKIKKRIADFHLDTRQIFPLGIIINELLTNKMKYAFIDRDSGLIKITLTNVAGHVTFTIEDNGERLAEDFDIKEAKGFGLMLVKMLSQQLGGSFSMENKAGTLCVVKFDI